MPHFPYEELLAQLTHRDASLESSNPWETLAATEPDHESPEEEDPRLDALLGRIYRGSEAHGENASTPRGAPALKGPSDQEGTGGFLPVEPSSIRAAGLTESEVEALVLKYLLARGDASSAG